LSTQDCLIGLFDVSYCKRLGIGSQFPPMSQHFVVRHVPTGLTISCSTADEVADLALAFMKRNVPADFVAGEKIPSPSSVGPRYTMADRDRLWINQPRELRNFIETLLSLEGHTFSSEILAAKLMVSTVEAIGPTLRKFRNYLQPLGVNLDNILERVPGQGGLWIVSAGPETHQLRRMMEMPI
jgi:hypothetical protein